MKRKDNLQQNVCSQTDREKAPVYAAMSALFSLFGLSGLFLGYYMGGSPAGHLIAGGAPILRGSLLGVVIEVLRGSISAPKINVSAGLAGFLPLFLYLLIPMLVAAIFLSFAMTIAAIFLPGSARRLCYQNGRLLLLPYGLLFLGNLLLRSLRHDSADFFDLSAAVISTGLLLFLFLASAAEHGGKGTVNFLLFLFSLFPLGAMAVPSTPLSKNLNDLVFSNGTASVQMRYVLLILCALSLFNIFLSVLRLNAKRGHWFDLLRFSLQLACGIALIAAHIGAGGTFSEFFSSQTLSAALLFTGPLCGCILSALAIAVFRKKALPSRKTESTQAEKTKKERKRYSPAPDFEEQPSTHAAF